MSFEWAIQIPVKDRPADFRAKLKPIFQQFGQEYNTALITQNLSGRHGDMGLNRRTGNLAGGWNTATTEDSSGLSVTNWVAGPAADTHGGSHGYAWAQEYGAVIRPVKSKFLWIPTEENRTPAGYAKMTPTEAIAKGGFISYKNGPVFFGVSGSSSKRTAGFNLTPLFILKKEVTIKPRMGATSLFKERIPMLERSIIFAAGNLL
jgi:hypothetical protein